MCYCCGSILWSRVDNSHTHLVRLDLDDENIPAVAYQCAMAINSKGCLEYHHKSGKLYACSVCTTFKNPKEYSNNSNYTTKYVLNKIKNVVRNFVTKGAYISMTNG